MDGFFKILKTLFFFFFFFFFFKLAKTRRAGLGWEARKSQMAPIFGRNLVEI